MAANTYLFVKTLESEFEYLIKAFHLSTSRIRKEEYLKELKALKEELEKI